MTTPSISTKTESNEAIADLQQREKNVHESNEWMDSSITKQDAPALENGGNVHQESSITSTASEPRSPEGSKPQQSRPFPNHAPPRIHTSPSINTLECSSNQNRTNANDENNQYLSYLHEQLEKSFARLCINLPAAFHHGRSEQNEAISRSDTRPPERHTNAMDEDGNEDAGFDRRDRKRKRM